MGSLGVRGAGPQVSPDDPRRRAEGRESGREKCSAIGVFIAAARGVNLEKERERETRIEEGERNGA